MAAYAALAQTTTLDTNHAISHFSIAAKEKIRSIHEYAIILLTFLEDYPQKANRWEGKLRDVAHDTEEFMGGIGKTTLARTVYDDPLIMYHFDFRVWLTISQDYNAWKVLLGLVDSMKLIVEQMSTIEMDDVSILKERVYKTLKSRRYLVVMDDVWSTKAWDDVRNVFPNDGNGSRIMLTTRLADLAVYPSPASAPHEMRFLNDSQSWDLLKGKVFANSNFPPELEDVGKKIARSCGGLPLAVVLVAGFLSEVNKIPSSWEEISENVNPIVGQELEGILSLSYAHLPHHLKPCFLFMAVFPEDEIIRASRLIRLWLAEGLLKHQSRCSKGLEEEAEEYLEDLVKRNLVIVSGIKSDGKIKCCSLHIVRYDAMILVDIIVWSFILVGALNLYKLHPLGFLY